MPAVSYTHLYAGVGVAFQLISALEGKEGDQENLFDHYAELVAIGTIGDIVPLEGCLLYTSYQGDGDLAAIGTAETVHAATRGENITVIFINNAIYGMTGGQMAPTSLPGQVTQTTPYGRDVNMAGYPIRICEMLSTLDGVALAQRVTVDCVKNVVVAKKAIKKAFENQIAKKGFSIVEVLSTCPTNWGMTPVEALDWLRENMKMCIRDRWNAKGPECSADCWEFPL